MDVAVIFTTGAQEEFTYRLKFKSPFYFASRPQNI
jgi:hypothetical protein